MGISFYMTPESEPIFSIKAMYWFRDFSRLLMIYDPSRLDINISFPSNFMFIWLLISYLLI